MGLGKKDSIPSRKWDTSNPEEPSGLSFFAYSYPVPDTKFFQHYPLPSRLGDDAAVNASPVRELKSTVSPDSLAYLQTDLAVLLTYSTRR